MEISIWLLDLKSVGCLRPHWIDFALRVESGVRSGVVPSIETRLYESLIRVLVDFNILYDRGACSLLRKDWGSETREAGPHSSTEIYAEPLSVKVGFTLRLKARMRSIDDLSDQSLLEMRKRIGIDRSTSFAPGEWTGSSLWSLFGRERSGSGSVYGPRERMAKSQGSLLPFFFVEVSLPKKRMKERP